MPVVLEAAGGERHHAAAACFLGRRRQPSGRRGAGGEPRAAFPAGRPELPAGGRAGGVSLPARARWTGPPATGNCAFSTHIVVRAGRPTFKKGRCVRPPTVAVGCSIRKTLPRQPEDSVSLSEETRAAATECHGAGATGASSCVPSDLCDFESQVP